MYDDLCMAASLAVMLMWSYGFRHSHEDTMFRFASRQGLGIGVQVQLMGWVVYVGSGGDPAPW